MGLVRPRAEQEPNRPQRRKTGVGSQLYTRFYTCFYTRFYTHFGKPPASDLL